MKLSLFIVGFLLCVSGVAFCAEDVAAKEKTTTLAPAKLNRIPGTDAIDIPPELSATDAINCVESAIRGTGDNRRRNMWISQWRMESRAADDSWVVIGLTARKHYLQVCYRVEGNKLIPDVPSSENLKQKGTSIHKKVPIWINNLKPLIVSQMYDATQAKRSAK